MLLSHLIDAEMRTSTKSHDVRSLMLTFLYQNASAEQRKVLNAAFAALCGQELAAMLAKTVKSMDNVNAGLEQAPPIDPRALELAAHYYNALLLGKKE